MFPRETEDALVALLAVQQELLSEAALEKVRERQAELDRPLLELLASSGKLSAEECEALRQQLDPELIPGFRLEREAGRGGMGVVYRARQLSLDRVVALKVLSRRLAEDSSYVEKFLAEARSAAKLNHENVVAAIDAGEAGGSIYYFAMEFIDGVTVAELLERDGALPWARTFEIAEKVARALEHAHQAGIVHRDVKPENVMLARSGAVKLCDLGLAKPAAIAGTGEKSDTTEGTPYYCSPEQALGRTDIDARSDIYSLGMTLFHMLAGEPCYDGENARAIMVKQVREPLPDLAERLPQVPGPLRELLGAMLVKEREKRLASVGEWRARLEAARKAIAAPPPRPTSRRSPALLGALAFGVLAATGIGLALLLGGETPQPPAQAGSDPARPAGPGVEEPGSRRPLPTRAKVDPPPTRPLPPTPTPSGPEAPTSAAGRALTEAREWLLLHPEDPLGAAERLRQVEEAHPGGAEAEQARRAREALREELRKVGLPRFKELGDGVADAVRERRFDAALALVDAFAAGWGRDLPELEDQLQKLRKLPEEAATSRLAELERGLQAADATTREAARAGLAQLGEQGELAAAQAARARLAALAQEGALSAAREAWTRALDARRAALAAGDLQTARGALQAASKREELAPLRPEMERALREQEALERAWAAFDQRCQALGDDGKAVLTLAGGGELRGRLVTYDTRAWSCSFKAWGAKEATPLELRALSVEQLLALALPPAEGRANALYFLARRHPQAAKAALDAAVAAGQPDDRDLRAEVLRLEADLVEARIADTLNRLLDPATPAAELIKGARELTPEVARSATYQARFEALKAAWIKARTAQLATDPALLFRGKLTRARKGDEVTLSWRFKDPAELEDWRADPKTVGTSRVEFREGAMRVSGKATLQGLFLGGALALEVKATTNDNARPNLNVILGDQGGWTGALCGLGYQFGTPRRIDVDPSAPRKPGYNVPLPANVLVVLSGQAPPAGITCWAAEDAPSVLGSAGKPIKLRAERDQDGEVRLKVKGRTVYSVGPVAGWDQPGSVALAPLEAEMLVSEVEVQGRLDPAWVEARGVELAQREAAALPAPPAPPPPK